MRSPRILALGSIVVVAAFVTGLFFLMPKATDTDSVKHAMEVSTQLSGYHFVSNGLNRKEGDWSAPGKLRMDVSAPKGVVSLIVINKDPYIKVPMSDTFAHIVNAFPNNDPMSFSSGPLLSSFAVAAGDVRNVINLGDDTIGGVAVVHFKYSYTPAGSTTGEIDREVWIEKGSGYVYQIRTAGELQIVETYSRINEPVTPPIEAPGDFTDVLSDSADFSLMIADVFAP